MVWQPSKVALAQLLALLADTLRVTHPNNVYRLYVLGGTALSIMGHTNQTLDVDVLTPHPLPKEIHDAVKMVAKATHSSPEWLNDGVGRMFDQTVPTPLPAYFFESEREHRIAQNLILLMPTRQALISSKLLAASPAYTKHTDDLMALTPTHKELREAVRFVLHCDESTPRRDDLKIIIHKLGHNLHELTR
jgi:hypothetical protein